MTCCVTRATDGTDTERESIVPAPVGSVRHSREDPGPPAVRHGGGPTPGTVPYPYRSPDRSSPWLSAMGTKSTQVTLRFCGILLHVNDMESTHSAQTLTIVQRLDHGDPEPASIQDGCIHAYATLSDPTTVP